MPGIKNPERTLLFIVGLAIGWGGIALLDRYIAPFDTGNGFIGTTAMFLAWGWFFLWWSITSLFSGELDKGVFIGIRLAVSLFNMAAIIVAAWYLHFLPHTLLIAAQIVLGGCGHPALHSHVGDQQQV